MKSDKLWLVLIIISIIQVAAGAWATYPHSAFKIGDGKDIDLAGTTIRNGYFTGIVTNGSFNSSNITWVAVGNGVLREKKIPRQSDIYQESYIQINNTYRNQWVLANPANYTNDFAFQSNVIQGSTNALVAIFGQCINRNDSSKAQGAGCWGENIAGFAEGNNTQAVASEINYGNAAWAFSGGMRIVTVPIQNVSNSSMIGHPEWPLQIQSQSKSSVPKEGIVFNSAVDSWDGGNWAQPVLDSLMYIPQNYASSRVEDSTWVNAGIDFHLGNFNGSALVIPFISKNAAAPLDWDGRPRNHGIQFANVSDNRYIFIDGNYSNVPDGIKSNLTLKIWNGTKMVRIEQDHWTTWAPDSPWSCEGGAPCEYMMDSMGFVHVRGEVTGGTAPDTIFTLPSGYRPAYQMFYTAPYNQNAGISYIQIQTSGAVFILSGGGTYLDLSATPPFRTD